MPVCRLASATKVFESAGEKVVAVDRAVVSVSPSEVVGIVGPSGSGKSTLLSLLGGLRVPTSGDAFFQESSLKAMSSEERRLLRLSKIGFVFQQLRLIPNLSVRENVALPMALLGRPEGLQLEKAAELVKRVGLEGKERRKPGQLSVGEQQRAAIARALVNDPILILADEPTSQLDTSSGLAIVELLRSLGDARGAAVVISTHDQKIGDTLERVYRMRDGSLA
jgi:putative ABC transport system ATP-binding protein